MPPRGPQIPLPKRAAILALHWHGGKSWIEISMMLLVHPETARKICVRAKERATDPTSFDDVLQHLEDLERPGRKHKSAKVKKASMTGSTDQKGEAAGEREYEPESLYRGSGGDRKRSGRPHRSAKARKLRASNAVDLGVGVEAQESPGEGSSKGFENSGGGYGEDGDAEFEWMSACNGGLDEEREARKPEVNE